MKLAGRVVQAAAIVAGLLVLGFYLQRVAMPQPLFTWDEDGFAIKALFSPEIIARNPFAPSHSNGAFIGLIRVAHAMSSNYLPLLRALNTAFYFGGILLVAGVATRSLPPMRRLAWVAIALAFPYYRFVVSGLPEGMYVGVLAALAAATALLYRPRPLVHGLVAGLLAAVLVLIKPHGLAVIAALVVVGAIDLVASGGWKQAPVRLAAFALAFFAAGNAVQWATGQDVASPAKFFVEDFYGGTLGTSLVPGAIQFGALALFTMGSAVALLAGIPLWVGLSDILRRWRQDRRSFRLTGDDLLFLLLAISLLATVCMAAIYTAKVASAPTEMKRLWGRYFEFFTPLVWLSAATFIERAEPLRTWRSGLVLAAIPLAGLAGLMLSFHAGVVLFPWDAAAMTAFFKNDLARAAFGEAIPFRPLMVLATLIAASSIASGASVSRVWLPYTVALGLLSTVFDAQVTGSMVQQRTELNGDLRAAAPALQGRPGNATLALTSDANDADIVFMGFASHPRVLVDAPATVSVRELANVQTLITVRVADPPAAAWTRTFKGRQISVFERRQAP
ncbi:MAG: hypothetical protein ACREEG_06925 [Phenylobacterium sp.]